MLKNLIIFFFVLSFIGCASFKPNLIDKWSCESLRVKHSYMFVDIYSNGTAKLDQGMETFNVSESTELIELRAKGRYRGYIYMAINKQTGKGVYSSTNFPGDDYYFCRKTMI